MKKFLLILCLWITASFVLAAPALQEGDIVFRSEEGSLAKAIQLATHSSYNHVGIVFIRKRKPYVLEAVQPVCFTPLNRWWTDGHCAAKRLKNAKTVLTPEVLHQMEVLADKSVGKKYSFQFVWSEDSFYCSGLVWKIYHDTTGLELGKFRKLKDYDLSSPLVKRELKSKYGALVPMNLKVISPGEIFKSDLLIPVESK
ncbi:MAG TPA: YiiX/YebB-like N1pC/P60 family cysteine hydrolase [bacterium]|nr:YiiX/YebB-like N1pC/P60 family cysteine hydrolase [bacterium]